MSVPLTCNILSMRKLTMEELGRVSRDQFATVEKRPIVLVLDNIRSGLNVGSIFRTADAFALQEIILCGITPQPPHREILKTALGATESVPWRYIQSIDMTVTELQQKGFGVWPVEQTDASLLLADLHWDQKTPVAFILGNEVSGVSDSVLTRLPQSIEIPQFGTKHSLNVAVSAGIVIWHLVYSGTKAHRLEGHAGL